MLCVNPPSLCLLCIQDVSFFLFFRVQLLSDWGRRAASSLSLVCTASHIRNHPSSFLFPPSTIHVFILLGRLYGTREWNSHAKRRAVTCDVHPFLFSTANITFPRVEAIFITNKNTHKVPQIKRNFILLWWVLRWMEYVMYQVGDDEANYSQFSTIYTAGQEDSLWGGVVRLHNTWGRRKKSS